MTRCHAEPFAFVMLSASEASIFYAHSKLRETSLLLNNLKFPSIKLRYLLLI